MNYIVFDLEWNQSPGGKRWSNSRLPFEIIEIGAIKLNEEKEIVDSFQRLIKPQVYNWIHDSIIRICRMELFSHRPSRNFWNGVAKNIFSLPGEIRM